ncbi:MAG: BTAD domain-containing putative transcriptional regulator [Thermodesulfovibrionales bacterium]
MKRMNRHTPIAKIMRPRLAGVLPRARLFGLLDRGCRSPVVWVNGPAGSGKTTLVASWLDAKKIPCLWYHLDEGDSDIATFFYYLGLAARRAAPRYKTPLPLLTMEYLRGVPTFTKRYFENLCSRLRPPHVIVLDNYHHLADNSPFHDMLRDALDVIPEGITVIINSRSTPPPSLALLNTYKKIHHIGWDELKFTLNETRSLMKEERKTRPPGETVEHLHRLTEGWAAGLTLLRERIGRLTSASHELDRLKPDEFFDYFATELFQKADEGTQNVLLKTAFLPHVSSNAAAELTGNVQAGTLLAALSRNHFFTEQRPGHDPIYQYHPLFQAFLQARARQIYAGTEICVLLSRAAELLEEEGQIEDAVELYRVSEAWDGLVRIILSNAQTMMSQGRNRLIEAWLISLPASLLEQDPWLLYWMGICRMPFALLEGRKYFEKAFALFRKRRDASGVFLAWAGVVESIIQELGDLSQMDPWIALLDALMKEYPVFPSTQIEGHVTARIFMALSLRQPWHPAFDSWRDKAIALLESSAEASLRMLCGFYLLSHFIQVGDAASCERVISTMRAIISSNKQVSPLAYIMGKMAEAWLAWTTCSYESCLRMMDEGLEKSRDSGVHLWDYLLLTQGLCASLMSGDVRRSEQLLGQMASALEHGRPLDKYYYYGLTGWHSMLHNDMQRAISISSTSFALATKIGFLGAEARSRLAQAHYMHVIGKYAQAKEHIAKCRTIGRKVKSAIIVFYCELKAAAIAFTEGDERAGLESLRDALTLGREKGYAAFNFTLLPQEELSSLCVKALEAGIEPDFVMEMIRKRKLVPETPPLHVENWPWPVKIFTLGRFEIVRDGEPIHFTGKVQKKPLEMLKVLIAFGSKDVDEERIADALWPDADGDTARVSFKSALHRLRQLLGNEEFIQLKEGRISLDRRTCWVDAWAFETVAEHVESLRREFESAGQIPSLRNPKNERYVHLLEKAVAMYHSHYLGNESYRPWALSLKERLRNKFLHIVDLLGDYWTTQQPSRSQSAMIKAIECYQRGIEIDDVAEEFYQKLMICYGKLGRNAEVAKVYKRCRDTLVASLGVEPSKETDEIYRNIIKL